MPLVRVIIPTYNRPAPVAEALDSVLAQTFSDFEVVVADDGSTDDTQTVLQRFSARDPRVKSLALPHGGVARARNAAIRQPGDHRYVAFLDSDDLWLPFHLEKAVEVLEREPTIGLFFGWYDRHDLTGRNKIQVLDSVRKPRTRATLTLGSDLYLLKASDCLKALLCSDFSPHTPTVVVRRDVVKSEEWFDVNLEVYSDIEFYLRVAANGSNFVYHDMIHDYERRLGDNLTGSTDLASPAVLRRYRSVANYRKMKLSFCNQAEDKRLVHREIGDAFYIIGECSREQSDLKSARNAYWRSLQHRISYAALRGLILSFLPQHAYSLLRAVKSIVATRVP